MEEPAQQQGASSASLQSLLDRIRKDGVDKAEAEAKAITDAAARKADELIRQADARAEATRKQAEADARKSIEQGQQALEQAARDVVLAVGAAVQNTLDRLIRADVGHVLKGEALQALAARVVDAYAAKLPQGAAIELTLSEAEQAEVARGIMGRLAEAARDGLEIRADRGVVSGFRVAAKGSSVEHDFTADAIAESICRLVRPQLAERVRAAQAKPASS